MGRRGVAWQDELRSHQSPGLRNARQAAKITGRETEGEDKVLQSGCRPCAEFIILQQVPQCFGGSKRRPTPIDSSHTSLPVNPLPTARSRSTCVSDMSYTGTLAKGAHTRRRADEKEQSSAWWAAQLQPHKRVEVRLGYSQQSQRHLQCYRLDAAHVQRWGVKVRVISR